MIKFIAIVLLLSVGFAFWIAGMIHLTEFFYLLIESIIEAI